MSSSGYLDSITDDFDDEFYSGVGVSNDIPDVWDIAINGRGYMLDTSHPAFGGVSAYLGRMGIETIPYIRQQADNSDEPGAATLNPDDLWTRAQSSWHKGAGQLYLDGKDSDRERFHSSFGINPWTKHQLNLLNTVSQIYTTTAVNVNVLRVGNYLYVSDNQTLKYATAPYSSWTSSTIAPGQQIYSLASDGNYIYAACGSAGVFRTTVGTNAGDASYNALACTSIAYVNGRLMAANTNNIYNITSGTTPTAAYTQPNTAFSWVGFAEGNTCIYSAGYAGDKSIIYRTAVKSDGTGLDVSFVAGTLPDGEVIASIQGYLNFVLVGTSKGVRLGTADSQGNLTFGSYINTNGSKVRCFEPQDRFVWFGWENYDINHTGLGRVDLTQIDSTGSPAYASDIMSGSTGSPVQGAVTSVATDLNSKTAFAVQGVGVFLETSTAVAQGTLDSGQLNYGLVAPKIALRMGVKHQPLVANSYANFYVLPDSGTAVSVGTSAATGTTTTDTPLSVPELAAVMFEIRIELNGPITFEHYEFKAYPSATRGELVHVPILLFEEVVTATGETKTVDVAAEYDYIRSYEGSQRLISYQELGRSSSAFIEDVNLQRYKRTSDGQWWNGTLLVVMKVLGE